MSYLYNNRSWAIEITQRRVALRTRLLTILMIALSQSWIAAAPRSTLPGASQPVIVVSLASIENAYADVAYLLKLVGNDKGFQTLRETTDLFIGGVNTQKPCEWRMFATSNGLRTVTSIPVTTETDLKTFQESLWDLDVKSAPPPKAMWNPRVPASVHQKLQSLQLQAQERIFFSLGEGFLRQEGGYAHLGESLDAVRLPWKGPRPISEVGTVTIHIDGQATSPARCREAFEKSKENVLARLKKAPSTTEQDFAFEKAFLDYQYSRLEFLVSESESGHVDWRLPHQKRVLTIQAEVTPRPDSTLASGIQQFGQTSDIFAGISDQGTVLTTSALVPVQAILGRSAKPLVKSAKEAVQDWLAHESNRGQLIPSSDREVSDLLFDILDEITSATFFNGCLRIWPSGNNSLSAVAAVQIPDGKKYQSRIQSLKTVQNIKTAIRSLTIQKIVVDHWRREFAEFFDQEGSLFIATNDHQIWLACGADALTHLEHAIQQTVDNAPTTSRSMLDMHVTMQPLAAAWSRIHSRQYPDAIKKAAKSSNTPKNSVAKSTSILASLDLPQIAAHSFQKGQDTISCSLKREGGKVILSAYFGEGTLQFLGESLSKFIKDYLE